MMTTNTRQLTDVQVAILAATAAGIAEVEAFIEETKTHWPPRSAMTNAWLANRRLAADWTELQSLSWRFVQAKISGFHPKMVQRGVRKLDELGLLLCVRSYPGAMRFSLVQPTESGLKVMNSLGVN